MQKWKIKENENLRKKINELEMIKKKYEEANYNNRVNIDKQMIVKKLQITLSLKDNKIYSLNVEISELNEKIKRLEKLKEMNFNFFKKENTNNKEFILKEKISKLNEEILSIKHENEVQERIIKGMKSVISALNLKLQTFKQPNENNMKAKFKNTAVEFKNCSIPCSKSDIFSEVEEK